MSREVVVIPTGTANLASVLAGLRRAGGDPRLSLDPEEITRAERVVLPGVGAFAPAMSQLRESGLVAPLRERVLAGRPTLAVCLGLQLLAAGSEESPGETGLEIFSARVERLPDAVAVPHMGWNQVEAGDGDTMLHLETGHAYFANSYCLREAPEGWRAATTNYGGRFVAALERDGVLACQFHPELSGPWGARLLWSWTVGVEEGASC